MHHAAKPQASDASGKQQNSARLSKLIRLIQASHLFRGYPPIAASDALTQAEVWDGFGLSVVPDDSLAEAFTRAMESLDDGASFGAPNVRNAWNDIRRERAEARANAQPNAWHRGDEITFAEWFTRDRDWIAANLTPDVQAMMKRLFDKRTQLEKAQ